MSKICLVTTCHGRLADLRRSLPALVVQEDADVVVVDYGCPDACGDWVAREFPRVGLVRVTGQTRPNLAHARNLGAAASTAPWLLFVDPHIVLPAGCCRALGALLVAGRYYRPRPSMSSLNNVLLVARDDFMRCGGYDEVLIDRHGGADLQQRLLMAAVLPADVPAHLFNGGAGDAQAQEPCEGGNGPTAEDLGAELYTRAKTDMMKLTGVPIAAEVRQALHGEASRIARDMFINGQGGKLEMGLGPHAFGAGEWILEPRVTLSVRKAPPVPGPRSRAADARPPMPFIIGSGRCGTTLLRLMLDSHPDLSIPYETHFIPDLAAMWRRASNPPLAAWNRIVSDPRWPSYAIDALLFRQELLGLDRPSLGDVLRVFFDLCAARFGKRRVGNKTANYIWDMAAIADHLPEARFIHVIRDGRDVALSFRGLWWGPQSAAEAAAWWASAIETARAYPRRDCYMEVRYEDLLRQPEAELRRICEFIDLPWSPAMLDYARIAPSRLDDIGDMPMADGRVIPADRIRGIHVKTQEPPDPSVIGKWRVAMTADDARQFGLLAGQLLEQLGYELPWDPTTGGTGAPQAGT